MSDLPDILIEKLEGAHRYERYIVALCPFHSDTRPSFFVYPDKYWCASCGKWGSTQSLIDQLDTFGIYQTYTPAPPGRVDFHNPWSKWSRNSEISRILEIAFRNSPVRYLQDRKIDRDVQRDLHIGIIENWITIPITDPEGKLIGAVARKGEGNPSQSKYVIPRGQDPNTLYVPSWDRVTAMGKIYLTFGILDAVTLYAAGKAAISTTAGMRVSPSAFDIIRKKIIIIPDLGEEKEALKLAAKLGWRGDVLQFDYPYPAKDINDLVWKCGVQLKELGEML